MQYTQMVYSFKSQPQVWLSAMKYMQYKFSYIANKEVTIYIWVSYIIYM